MTYPFRPRCQARRRLLLVPKSRLHWYISRLWPLYARLWFVFLQVNLIQVACMIKNNPEAPWSSRVTNSCTVGHRHHREPFCVSFSLSKRRKIWSMVLWWCHYTTHTTLSKNGCYGSAWWHLADNIYSPISEAKLTIHYMTDEEFIYTFGDWYTF